ncbi:MAG: hypothetical protein RL095_1088 [Verrucomicrobiota bacterium]|jgi:hypothetical protein
MIMKELISKHLEKLICIIALLGVCIACVLAMTFHLEQKPLDVIEPKGTEVVKKIEAKEFSDPSVKLKENGDSFDGSGYVYCRNPLCASLVNSGADRCKKCNTPITLKPEIVGGDDPDKDLIPSEIEIRENLDPKNPEDAAEDRDKDGFSNFDELMTFEGKSGCVDDDKDHPPFIALYSAVKAPVRPLPFTVSKIDRVDGGVKKWEVQLSFTHRGKQRKTTKTIEDNEPIVADDELLGYTLTAIAVDETDPENTKKMKLTFENAKKEQVEAELGNRIDPPNAFRIDFSNGKHSFALTKLGEKFSLKGPNNEVQNFILREWDAKKSVAKVFCQEDKTESEVGAKPAVKCPVKKQ